MKIQEGKVKLIKTIYFIYFFWLFLFRQKKNLEMELHVTKGSVEDLKLLLDSHKKEILSLQESLVRHQVHFTYITIWM